MSYTIRNRIRWSMATFACLFATYDCMDLTHTVMVTWGAAEMFSPDETHLAQIVTVARNTVSTYAEMGRLVVELVQKVLQRVRAARNATLP